jgi:hypothetical protein
MQRTSAHKERYEEWYNGEFPESFFVPKEEEAKKEYNKRVEKGYDNAKNRRVVIMCLARDNENNMQHAIKEINKIGKIFKDYAVIVFENDSRDRTRSLIEEECKNNAKHWKLIECKGYEGCKLSELPAVQHGALSKNRMAKMAHFRNLCLRAAKENYGTFENAIVYDTDIGGTLSLDGLAHCFSYEGWHCMSAYGMSSSFFSLRDHSLFYYDQLALLLPHQTVSSIGNPRFHLFKSFFFSSIPPPSRGGPLIPVTSAFGGCAIYDFQSLISKDCHYCSTYCEHVCLHLQMRDKGLDQHFINPNFLLFHTVDVKF